MYLYCKSCKEVREVYFSEYKTDLNTNTLPYLLIAYCNECNLEIASFEGVTQNE